MPSPASRLRTALPSLPVRARLRAEPYIMTLTPFRSSIPSPFPLFLNPSLSFTHASPSHLLGSLRQPFPLLVANLGVEARKKRRLVLGPSSSEEMSEVSVINQAEDQAAGGQLELPPGFRFFPADEEIISHYLTPKALDRRFTSGVIGEVDLNKCEPWDLPG
jgi:hypothetical protein